MSLARWIGAFWLIAAGIAGGQDHPAFTAPAGFSVAQSSGTERVFVRVAPNGDRLRVHVLLQPGGGDVDAIAKGPALGDGDGIRSETRQEIAAGTLRGVGYSVLGKSETIDGVAYTRYRRVMGLAIEGNPVAWAVRADILAKEPKPAQSTLEAMGRALTEWQQRLGGVSGTPAPEGEAPSSSKPPLGGEQIVRVTGGGDLELQVPAFWGRANLAHGPGHEEILLGPAREVVEKATVESIAKDKDRIGPYISIVRIQKDTFADLIDEQLLDIQESLLADYVARMAEGGITLVLSEDRDAGLLGTRTVISVPFEESRASGTKHRGRSVFMMHRGSLVIVTASHPVEKFDEGWPDIAKAFDTLLFTGDAVPGAPEPPESRPMEGAAGAGETPPTPAGAAPANDPRRPAPADWITGESGGVKTVEIPLATPIALSIPAAWALLGSVDDARPANTFFATPGKGAAEAPLGSWIRIDYFPFLEQLAADDAIARLAALMRLRLEQEARTLGVAIDIFSEQQVTLAGRTGAAIQYGFRKGADRATTGTFTGTVLDGTTVIFDLRIAIADASALAPVVGDSLASIRIRVDGDLAARTFGPYSMLVPPAWEVSDEENQGGGRNVFVRSPAGADLRFQTALQKRQEVVDTEVLRRVATGFLVEGLKVLTLKDMAAARRHLAPGGLPGLRFETSTPQVDVLVLAYMQGDHLVFALRGVPPGYRGRDLAIAWRIMRSFSVAGADQRPGRDPVRVAGTAVSHGVAFARTELDAVAPDGTPREASSLFIALLPDGSARVVASRGGRIDDLRGTYLIDGGQIAIEGPGLGRMVYRIGEDGETLTGEAPGDVVFRARHEETP